MHHVTVKILQDTMGNLVLFPSRKLYNQIRDRVEDMSVFQAGYYLQGVQIKEFLDSLTPYQQYKIKREANHAFPIAIRLYDEHAWALFGAAY